MSAAVKERMAKSRRAATHGEVESLRQRIEDLEDLIRMRNLEDRTDPKDYLPIELVDRVIAGEHPTRIWREHRGLSLHELSRRSNVPTSYLSEIENDKKPGSISAYGAIAKVLNVKIDDLVK